MRGGEGLGGGGGGWGGCRVVVIDRIWEVPSSMSVHVNEFRCVAISCLRIGVGSNGYPITYRPKDRIVPHQASVYDTVFLCGRGQSISIVAEIR